MPARWRERRTLAGGAAIGVLVVGSIAVWALTSSPGGRTPAGGSGSTVPGNGSGIPGAEGVANDEPCSMAVPVGMLELAPVPFHHEDLERMVLSPADVGGLPGFEVDPFLQGYHDNAEVTSIEVNPPSTCQDIARLGRIEGYANAVTSGGNGRSVMFAVHLFWTDEGAAAWEAAFFGGLRAAGATMTDVAGGVGVPGSRLIEHQGPDGTRTWASFVRGPIVAWIVDLHAGDSTTIDVPAAAAAMSERIESVIAEVDGRPPDGLDVAQLLSAPLPRVAWGDLGAGLDWDFFFGGCQDTAERGFIAGEQAAADAERFGRLTGCTAMYSPPGGGGGDVVRVFSSVHVYQQPDGASAALAAAMAELATRGGVGSPVLALADEAAAIAVPAGGDGPADNRVAFRRGNLLAIVSIQGPAATHDGAAARMADLARELDARIRRLLEAD